MSLSNEQRTEFKALLKTMHLVDATFFLAEYMAEKIVVEYGNSNALVDIKREYISLFDSELNSQINERI